MSFCLISHRGNLNGPIPERENRVDYILEALAEGFDVEIDVRGEDGKLYLGHDEIQEEISIHFLVNTKLWVHAKNTEAVKLLQRWPQIHFFWHQTDDFIFTSKQRIWTYPGKEILNGAIAVLPESVENWDIANAGGVCSDYVNRY